MTETTRKPLTDEEREALIERIIDDLVALGFVALSKKEKGECSEKEKAGA